MILSPERSLLMCCPYECYDRYPEAVQAPVALSPYSINAKGRKPYLQTMLQSQHLISAPSINPLTLNPQGGFPKLGVPFWWFP